MIDIDGYKKHQSDFLERVKSRKEPVVYEVVGIDFIINPKVFPPATDTKLLASNIHLKPGESTLDLTSGSGVCSVVAGLQGAVGVAVDINPEAVKNSNENFSRYNVQMRAIESNLYENVPDEQFDQIFANGPFFEGDVTDVLDHACYGAKAFIDGLFSGLKTRLKKTGKLLVVIPAWSDLKHFEETASNSGFQTTLVTTRKSDDGIRTYNLYKVSAII